MATKDKSLTLLLFLSLFLLSATLVLAKTDPKEEHCRQKCHIREHDKSQRRKCELRCREEHSEREEERDPWQRGGEQRRRELQQCKIQCHQQQPSQGEKQIRECEWRCEDRFGEGSEQARWEIWLDRCKIGCGHNLQPHDDRSGCERRCDARLELLQKCYEHCINYLGDEMEVVKCERQCEEFTGHGLQESEEEGRGEGGRSNPYYWGREGFRSRIKTEEGHIRVLERFNKRSELLRGVENYRLAILEANPNTFVIPSHRDAEGIFFVMKGRGTISFVQEDKKESHDMQEGDIIRVPAGMTTYMINRDKREKLQIAKLLHPISTPGKFKEYFAAGGENPESFYRSFSNNILEAAFNTPRDMLEKVLGQQTKGAIVRASPQQIKALTGGSRGARWPFPESKWKPYNMFSEKRPVYSNNWGQLYEVDHNDFTQLRDLNVAVSFANISKGAMMAPLYNSEATKILVVVQGRGYFEMACPHISDQQEKQERQGSQEEEDEEEEGAEEQSHQRYQKVGSRLSPGDVFVAPPGHPIVTVASRDENLQIVCFEINAKNNQKFFLTGKNNILKQLEREAKELSFGVSAREVDQVLNAQRESVFLPGPEQQQHQEKEEREGHHGDLETILSFVAF